MSDGSGLWSLLTIIGPVVLVVAIIWAIMHNRSSRRSKDRTEAATARMYDEQDRADHASNHPEEDAGRR